MSTAAPLRFRAAVRSDVGTVRENNEDSAYADADFLVLADGMGGHSSGEVASAVAVHTFASAAQSSLPAAARRTREILRHMSGADEALHTMGTTVVALQRVEGAFHLCHIGDSRVYLLRDGQLRRLTTDHTHVQHLVELGRITPEQVATHPYRAMLLKSLDDQPGGADPDLLTVDLHEGDRVLLCSDGLSDYVNDHVIGEALRRGEPTETAEALVATAIRAGTRDNITVIVADLTTAPGTEPQLGGAAAEALSLSPQACRALTEIAPDFTGALTEPDAAGDDPLTRTTLLPRLSADADADADAEGTDAEAAEQGQRRERPRNGRADREQVPVAGILAAGAVVVVAGAIALFL